jgi:hypothetical protein
MRYMHLSPASLNQAIQLLEQPERAGIRAGNILLSVDGKPVRNHEEAEVLLDGFENTVPELELRDGARRIAVRMVREPPARY